MSRMKGRADRTRRGAAPDAESSYWASADGADRRIVYVTPGYRMIALDARTGAPVPTFGQNGVVDLKLMTIRIWISSPRISD